MKPPVATQVDEVRTLARLAAHAADLLRHQCHDDGLGVLHKALAALVPLTNFIVCEFAPERAPELIDSNYERSYLLEHLALYRRGLYLLDPFWRTVRERHAGLVHLDDIAPPDFRESEYFLRHYRATDVVDELRFVVPCEGQTSVHVFVEREAPLPPFAPDELARLADVEPFVRAWVEGHVRWRFRERTPSAPQRPAFDLRTQIQALRPGELTPREIDILELMLKGHSAKSMASALGIEEGTVTNHKRNIYAKVGVHSQAQLFDRFLRTLAAR